MRSERVRVAAAWYNSLGAIEMNRHELAEERGLALHREVGRRLLGDPAVLAGARRRVEGWLQGGTVHAAYASAWREILEAPAAEIARLLEDPGERARALRQVTPFAGVVPARERWRIWDEVRRRLERAA